MSQMSFLRLTVSCRLRIALRWSSQNVCNYQVWKGTISCKLPDLYMVYVNMVPSYDNKGQRLLKEISPCSEKEKLTPVTSSQRRAWTPLFHSLVSSSLLFSLLPFSYLPFCYGKTLQVLSSGSGQQATRDHEGPQRQPVPGSDTCSGWETETY